MLLVVLLLKYGKALLWIPVILSNCLCEAELSLVT